MKRFRLTILRVVLSGLCVIFPSVFVAAQSRDQNFPAPITTNEIGGTIKARDVGDSRLTSYYYVFDGGQGDIFINVVTKNFTGDIDVFTQDSLRPLAKMVIYADAPVSETGRLVYLRKDERLILRIEGRSPNDDPATFRVKFAGSFIAIKGQKGDAAPELERLETDASDARVNSVGTIIKARPKLVPPVKAPEVKSESVGVEAVKEKTAVRENATIPANDKTQKKTVVVVEDNLAKIPAETPPKIAASKPVKTIGRSRTANPPTRSPVVREEKNADPLASIRLIIQFKDSRVIERPMSEVSKFSVDKGVLTVVAKNGKIVRYSILDVAKVTIE